MIQSVEFSVFYSYIIAQNFSHRWEQVLNISRTRWTYKMFTEFFILRAGNLTRKYYNGIREHAGIDFIVSPGRPDIWRKYIAGYEIIKNFQLHFIRKTGYLTQKQYIGIRNMQVLILLFHRAGRIFGASILRVTNS